MLLNAISFINFRLLFSSLLGSSTSPIYINTTLGFAIGFLLQRYPSFRAILAKPQFPTSKTSNSFCFRSNSIWRFVGIIVIGSHHCEYWQKTLLKKEQTFSSFRFRVFWFSDRSSVFWGIWSVSWSGLDSWNAFYSKMKLKRRRALEVVSIFTNKTIFDCLNLCARTHTYIYIYYFICFPHTYRHK